MNNITKSSDITQVLEDIFDKYNKAYYDGKLIKPIIIVGVLQGKQRSRFCANVNEIQHNGQKIHEYTLDGDLINLRDIDSVVHEILVCMLKQFDYENKIGISSRSGAYYNKKLINIANSHGLTVEYIGKYKGYRVSGINDQTRKIIEENRWVLLVKRESYTYGTKSNDYRHDYLYKCDRCGDSFHATKNIGEWTHNICGGIANLIKYNGIKINNEVTDDQRTV